MSDSTVVPRRDGDGADAVVDTINQTMPLPPPPVMIRCNSASVSFANVTGATALNELALTKNEDLLAVPGEDEYIDPDAVVTREGRIETRIKSTATERYSSMDTSNLETLLNGGLDRFYGKYKNAWKKHNLSFPTPEISFDKLSYAVKINSDPQGSKRSIGGFLRTIAKPWRKLKPVKKQILHPMTGTIRAGSMTLVLANPGAGKSTLLKALAGKLTGSLKGSITYSGLPADEIQISKLVGLVDQQDNHFPTLTVRETIQFADLCLNGAPESQPEKLREVARLRTDLCLHILGLTKCADTVVGDAMLRGVSGGERKRVTLGEMLVGGQSVFLCDEVSTGLDSAATFDIMKSLRSWTRTLGGSAVVALLQPPPEVVDLFDDVLILTEGRLVYHGPTKEMVPYFSALGFACPSTVDPAEFVVDVVCGRGAQYLKQCDPMVGGLKVKPPRRAQHFEDVFQQSEAYRRMVAVIEEQKKHSRKLGDHGALSSVRHLISKAEAQKTPPFATGFFENTWLVLGRQVKIWSRDKALIYGKLVEAVMVGLLLGIIYLDAPVTIYLRMLFFIIAIFQRQAWQQITIGFQVRNVFYKQRSRNFFRTLSYTLAESLVQIPLNIAVSFVLCVIFYFMSGLSRAADSFILFYVIIASFQHAISAYFALLGSLSPSLTIAQALASLSVSFFLLFSGNILLPLLIPEYWVWMYWFNPVAWTLRALLLNEFHSSRHTVAVRTEMLDRFQVTPGKEFIWIGILVLLAYYVLFTLLNTLALHFIRYETQSTAGSTSDSLKDSYSICEDQPGTVTPKKEVVIEASSLEAQATGNGTATACVPAYLAVQNLDYFVPHPANKGEQLQLLHGITAHFIPGQMTALMGSSGAGKTTFMDVLAGRKTGGTIKGEILVNGEPKNPATFSRIAGYCEQMDIHSGGATIQEALEFSASLRLPASTTPEERAGIVRTTMDLLELHGLANEVVRNCSIEQKKRITIGVEVVANPSILFLDEPTSGLDARAASIVMRGVRSIAKSTGRTVLCTIHQPSMAIFELFDSLLLLQKGGYMAFFGELGEGSSHLLEYFASIPGTPPMPTGYNPATYMLEVIGAGIGRQSKDYSVEYSNSALRKANNAKTTACAEGSDGVAMTKFSTLQLTPIATGFLAQLRACGVKMQFTYWRTPQYNLMRILVSPVYAVIFGTTFYQLTQTTQAAVNSHVGLMYNTLDFMGVINMMTVLDIVTSERAVFYRERMSNYYGPLPYALSLFLAEVPYLLLTSLAFMNVQYWLVGWQATSQAFFLFWLVFFLHIAICTSVGQLMAVLMPNIKVANVAVGALSVFFNLFSGFLMPHISMRGFYKWIRYLMPTNYSLETLVGIELGQCDHATSHGCQLVALGKVNGVPQAPLVLKDFVFKFYGFEYADRWVNIGVLFGFWFIVQVAIYLTLRFVSHLKR